MSGFLSAHGFDPGPTQRPYTAGALSALIATIPAVAILHLFGSLEAEAHILRIGELLTIAAGVPVMAAAGAIYGRLFGRAANDKRGGWLFGMGYGFALWATGGVMVLPLASGGLTPVGIPAIGMFLSLVIWGTALGVVHPFIQRPFHQNMLSASKSASVGPSAAASAKGPGPERQPIPPRN